MTAKEAIKARCKDCHEGVGDCRFPDCPLFGLRKSTSGARRPKAIREYCKWCRNGLSYDVCSSSSCSIYKYLNLGQNMQAVADLDEEA